MHLSNVNWNSLSLYSPRSRVKCQGVILHPVHRLHRPFCSDGVQCLFIHTAHRALMSKIHWAKLLKAKAFISATLYLAQCLANYICLIGASKSRASFLKNEATIW